MSHVVFDEEWLRKYSQRTGISINLQEQQQKRAKYGNTKTQLDGQKFDSLHEAEVYKELLLRVKANDLRAVITQQTFLLPGGVKYIADFVTLNNDGTYSVLDAKSDATKRDKVYRLKKRQMRECLNITIEEV